MCKINLNQTSVLSINYADLGNGFTETVSATELHQFLEVNDRFDQWIKRRIELLGFEENQDFTTHKTVRKGLLSREYTEYFLTIEAAKHISMAERNEKGRQARKYFIQVEDHARAEIPKLQKMLREVRETKDQTIHQLTKSLLDRNPVLGQIHRYTQLGLTQSEIAKLCDTSKPIISKHQHQLADLSIIDRPQRPVLPAKNYTTAQLDDMIRRRDNGESYNSIAKDYSCSGETIKNRIKQAGAAS